MTTQHADHRAAGLRAALAGRAILPDDPAYETARLAWNRAADQRPLAVATPESIAEVADVVRAAARHGLRVAPQSTGHAAGALAGTDLSDVILLSLARLRGVRIDPDSCTATVSGGTLWREVLEAAAPYGLTALHGSAGDISVAGYLLHGGLSFYGRQHGLAVGAVRSAQLVTAQGDIVTASHEENPELFWALRGGAGGFGVVVELEIDLLPYADVFAGMLLWDASKAADVIPAWAAWTREAPESVTTSLRVMHFPPLEELPAFLRSRSVVVIDGAVLEQDDRAAALVRPLRGLGPEIDTFERIPSADLVHMHMDPPEPTPAASAHAMIGGLPAEATGAFLAAAMEARPMISEIRHVGAAFSRQPARPGAVSSLDGDYAMSAIQVIPAPHLAPAATQATHAVVDALASWHAPSLAATFIDEPGAEPERIFGTCLTRLSDLKRRHDPNDMFATAHPLA
ncbi:MAG TPA: FAD-binding oxidoreductase [Microbacteriaceae bacterium]|nr:FAD-binding oxidoreductase [Microbacteriaceae bacterium]